jgi:TonB family protein
MRHRSPRQQLLTLVSACLIAVPPATPQAANPASGQPALHTPAGPPAIAIASDPETLAKQLTGKTFYLRGFYQDEHLEFDTLGNPSHTLQKGSFTLSAVEIDQVKFTKHSMELKGHRMGLHFFGALPYEDDSKPFEVIKVDPKKSVEIDVERLVIEPEKKKKKKDLEKEQAAKAAAAKPGTALAVTNPSAAAAPATSAKADAAAPQAAAELTAETAATAPDAPSAANATPAPAAPASGAAIATAASAAPNVSPDHDPRISFQQLSKAVNVLFAPGLNDSVIATLPPYWQNYFATKAGRSRAAQLDSSALRPGGDVKPPQLLTALDPASNEYAQKNNIAGLIFLQTVVGANGQPGDVTIVRPIGFGLDEKAVEAVQHARFRPGTLNGQPVTEVVNLQVTFRIYSERTRPTGAPAPAAAPTEVAPKQSPKGPPSTAPVLASAAAPQ